MPEYRVTKYDPARRDERGVYPLDEWTAYSDVGTSVSAEDYARAEGAYVRAARSFMEEAGVSRLVVRGLEAIGTWTPPFAEGASLAPEAWSEAFRMVLREQAWCRFVARRAFVHFGYDYYMYACRRTALLLSRRPLEKAYSSNRSNRPISEDAG